MNERLSDYLLGELPPDERARFEAALARDEGLRSEVDRLAPVVSRLEHLEPAAWDPPALPPLPPLPELDVRGTGARTRERWWKKSLALPMMPAAALAVALLALGVVAGLLVGGGDDEGVDGRVIALAPVEETGAPGASGEATFASSGGRATVRVSGLPPSGDGEFYELWLLNSADDLVSLGSFDVPASGEIEVTVPVPNGGEGFAAIDVSVEPADGDPAHSAESVLRAPLEQS